MSEEDRLRLDAQVSPALIEDARLHRAAIAELDRRDQHVQAEAEYGLRPRIQAAGARLRGRVEGRRVRSPDLVWLAGRAPPLAPPPGRLASR